MEKKIMISAFIPHYREELIKGISKNCDLTVTSLDPKKFNLIDSSASMKEVCNFVETENIGFLERWFKINIVPKEMELLTKKWDTVYAFYSLRYPHRFLMFLFIKMMRKNTKWIWVGHIYGKNNSIISKIIRKYFLNASDGVLTYTEEYVDRLKLENINTEILSFNNTFVNKENIMSLPIMEAPLQQNKLHLIYVGRYQPRKKLERLIALAKRRNDIYIRLIGPGMDKLQDLVNISKLNEKIKIYGALINNELIPHFEWAHLVVNPGHAGLLVVTAGQYSRPIIIDNQTEHAPEYIIAKDANQFFVDWGNNSEVDEVLNRFKQDHSLINKKGKELLDVIKRDYTVEKSVKAFMTF